MNVRPFRDRISYNETTLTDRYICSDDLWFFDGQELHAVVYRRVREKTTNNNNNNNGNNIEIELLWLLLMCRADVAKRYHIAAAAAGAVSASAAAAVAVAAAVARLSLAVANVLYFYVPGMLWAKWRPVFKHIIGCGLSCNKLCVLYYYNNNELLPWRHTRWWTDAGYDHFGCLKLFLGHIAPPDGVAIGQSLTCNSSSNYAQTLPFPIPFIQNRFDRLVVIWLLDPTHCVQQQWGRKDLKNDARSILPVDCHCCL